MDLDRARKIIKNQGMAGVISHSIENSYYLSGYPTHVSTAGSYSVVFPADPDQAPAVVTSEWEAEEASRRAWIKDIRTFESWIYLEREGFDKKDVSNKPEQFNSLGVLLDCIREKKLQNGKIGIEMDRIPVSYFETLKKALPDAHLVNASGTFLEMRSVKTKEEVGKQRRATEIAEEGIRDSLTVAREGATEFDCAKAFMSSVVKHEYAQLEHVMLSAGINSATPHLQFPTSVNSNYAIRKGDIYRTEVGVKYDGYFTDLCKNYVIGKPSERQAKLFSVLSEAQRMITEAMKPGVKLSELYKMAMKHVRENGFPNYSRGHVGHSISLGPFSEEAPFISPTEDRKLVPGMVFSVEVPFYIIGWGGFNPEDMVLVTEDGHELLSKLPNDICFQYS